MSGQRFDDYSDVKECNDCEQYWNSACDGPLIGQERPCKSFKAVRRVDFPVHLKRVEDRVRNLTITLIGFEVLFLIHLVSHILGE